MATKNRNSHWIGILNIIIGLWTILSCALTQYYENIGTNFYYPSFVIGVLYIGLGYKLKNNRFAIISLIILHLIQTLDINNNFIEYYFSFGPHLKFDLLNWNLYFSVGRDWISLRFGGFISDLNPPTCKISITSIAFVVLLVKELKALQDNYSEPWESEFNK